MTANVPRSNQSKGTGNERRLARYKELGVEPPSLHSPLYYPDAEESLRTGIQAMTAAVSDLLRI